MRAVWCRVCTRANATDEREHGGACASQYAIMSSVNRMRVQTREKNQTPSRTKTRKVWSQRDKGNRNAARETRVTSLVLWLQLLDSHQTHWGRRCFTSTPDTLGSKVLHIHTRAISGHIKRNRFLVCIRQCLHSKGVKGRYVVGRKGAKSQ